ncbi:hypothetical protein LZC95_33810 [Pendulispora brunnea]|uniref:Lipoprotein n=1 Tax=Pendulispora brunnea TaxID=2905690 RepID=A0ABZ2JY92_9BACT
MGCSSGDSADDAGKSALPLSTISGHVTAQGSGSTPSGLAGQGTLGVTKSVRASAFVGGQFRVVGSAELTANGSYSIRVPTNSNADIVVVEALDASGQVVGSSLLETISHEADGSITAAPISTESSIEAKAFVDLAISGAISGDEAVSVAAILHRFVDANVEARIAAAANAGIDPSTLVHSVAKAGLMAHKAQARSLANAKVSVDARAIRQTQIDAAVSLNESLDTTFGLDAQAAATASLNANVRYGASVDIHANAKAESSLVFDSALCASFDAAIGTAKPDIQVTAKKGVFLAVQKAAKVEADATVSTLSSALAAKNAPAASIDVVTRAGIQLQTDINVAVDAKGILDAQIKFLDTLNANAHLQFIGGFALDYAASIQGSFEASLGLCLKVEAGFQADFKASLDVVGSLSVDLEHGKLSVAAEGKLNASFDATFSGYLKVTNSCPVGGGGHRFTPVPPSLPSFPGFPGLPTGPTTPGGGGGSVNN